MAKYVVREGTVRGEGRYYGTDGPVSEPDWRHGQRDAFVFRSHLFAVKCAENVAGHVVRLVPSTGPWLVRELFERGGVEMNRQDFEDLVVDTLRRHCGWVVPHLIDYSTPGRIAVELTEGVNLNIRLQIQNELEKSIPVYAQVTITAPMTTPTTPTTAWVTPYKDAEAHNDRRYRPAVRTEHCLHCGKSRVCHTGWSCSLAYPDNFDQCPESMRFLTQEMWDSLVLGPAVGPVKLVSYDITFTPRSVTTPDDGLKTYANLQPHECPCGIARSGCEYHK